MTSSTPAVPPGTSLSLAHSIFRIIQESTINAIHHSAWGEA